MGATLVKHALERAREARLDHAPTRALVHMAVTALDTRNSKGEPPDRYFYGRVSVAFAMGYGADDPDEADSKAAHSAVGRAVQMLLDKGLIRLIEPAHSGRSAVYDLSPLRSRWSVDNQPIKPEKVPAQRVGGLPAQRVAVVPAQRAQDTRTPGSPERGTNRSHGGTTKRSDHKRGEAA